MDLDSTQQYQPVHLSELSPANRRLFDVIRQNGYGCIEALPIRDGDPDWNSKYEVTDCFKPGSPRKLKSACEPAGDALNKQFSEVFREFKRRKNCVVKILQYQDGIPLEVKFKGGAV